MIGSAFHRYYRAQLFGSVIIVVSRAVPVPDASLGISEARTTNLHLAL